MLPTRTVECPYCGEPIELIIDDSVDDQSYIEDCAVCCRPICVAVSIDAFGQMQVSCRTDNEA
jgi:hypothetical protein